VLNTCKYAEVGVEGAKTGTVQCTVVTFLFCVLSSYGAKFIVQLRRFATIRSLGSVLSHFELYWRGEIGRAPAWVLLGVYSLQAQGLVNIITKRSSVLKLSYHGIFYV